MQYSTTLALAYVAPQQAQQHVTMNEAFRRLDMLAQASVKSRTAAKLDVDGPVRVKNYTVGGVPAAPAGAGQIIFVSKESGGAAPAFSDGANARRVTDRAVVS